MLIQRGSGLAISRPATCPPGRATEGSGVSGDPSVAIGLVRLAPANDECDRGWPGPATSPLWTKAGLRRDVVADGVSRRFSETDGAAVSALASVVVGSAGTLKHH